MKFLLPTLAWFCLLTATWQAQVPQLINYQGRVAVAGVPFNGSGAFKFGLVNATGTKTFWAARWLQLHSEWR